MKKYIPLIVILFLVIGLWLGCLLLVTSLFNDWPTRGQFGDLFGSVNALFSGLAFAGLIYTIILQRNELQLQREELKLQREEMEKSRKELSEQAKAQRLQFTASIAHLKAEAAKAYIEALKSESEARVPGARGEYEKEIRAHAANIEKLAKKLEEHG